MKLRLLIIPALMATALFAQGPGGRRQANGTSTPPTPPTAGQLATREVNMIATFLGLTPAQTTTLSSVVLGDLTTEETTLLGNAPLLNAAYAKLDLATVNSLLTANLAARVTAAGFVMPELQSASIMLTTAQVAKLPGVLNMLVGGGGPGGFGVGFRGGPRN